MPRKPKETPEGQTHLDDAAPAEDPKPKADKSGLVEVEKAKTESPEQQAADTPYPGEEQPAPTPDEGQPAVFEDAPTLEEALEPLQNRIQRLVEALVADRDHNDKRFYEVMDSIEKKTTSPAFELSNKTDKLFPALLEFHTKCAGLVGKDSDNPFFRSSYASRAQIKRVTHASMMEAGLFVMNSRQVIGFHEIEMFDSDKNKWRKVNCCRMNQVQRITHAASGQYVQTAMLMDSKGTGPQAMGTVDSYGARYNSIALLDLAAEDDDGEAGQGRAPAGRKTAGQRAQDKGQGGRGNKKTPASDAVKKAREALMKEIKDRIEEAGILGEVQPSKILQEVTRFPRKGKDDFPGYKDIEEITAMGMVEASFRRLQNEHPMLSDEALGRSA